MKRTLLLVGLMILFLALNGCKQEVVGNASDVIEGEDDNQAALEKGSEESQVTSPKPTTEKGDCIDTDGGDDPYTAGKVYGRTADGEEFEVRDSCYNDFLLEYWCDEETGEYRNTNYRCSCEREDRTC
ncbi:hypothetical protein GF351_03505 [Candidatus Woesearchaeota archaeon]|nr:hypothetical protein [Candidatus Woesearchaeota archaeon]